MADRYTIEFDFQKALTQAERLEEIGQGLNTLADTRLYNILQDVSANWKGENASSYLNKGSVLQNRITNTGTSLKSIAEEIRSMARRIYEAEMRNLEIAEERQY